MPYRIGSLRHVEATVLDGDGRRSLCSNIDAGPLRFFEGAAVDDQLAVVTRRLEADALVFRCPRGFEGDAL